MTEQQNLSDALTQHLPFLNRMVVSRMRNRQMAEDVVQQAVLKALVHADQLRFEPALKTWLASIAINEARQTFRSKWLTRMVSLTAETLDADRSDLIEYPGKAHDAKERQTIVRQAVSLLPESYRAVVELCDLQEVSMREAARRLGLTLAAVKSRRHRARKHLRDFVSKFA